MKTWIKRFGAMGDRPEDSKEARLKHRLLVYMATLMSAGGLVWGVLAGGLNLFWPCIIPLSYAVITAVNLASFSRWKNFPRVRFVQVLASLLLPFLFQFSVGGFRTSGVGMLWAMLAILGSLTFGSTRSSLGWLALYLVLTVVSGFTESYARALFDPGAPEPLLTLFYVLNVTAISSIVFGLTIWLMARRDEALDEYQQTQEQLTETNAELERNNALLRRATEEAQAADRVKTTFLATMSHELRTPLNAVIGMADLLRMTSLDPTQRTYSETIRTSGQLLLGLVSDILDLSRIESGELALNREEVDVRVCARSAVELVRRQAEDKGVELSLHIAEAVPVAVEGDPRRLAQILLNLLTNAVKFTDAGSVSVDVRVDLDEGGDYAGLVCRVDDTGIGLRPENLERLTQPFVQADSSISRRFGGTGLGLAITQNLVRLHGGTLTVQARELPDGPGPGTSFCVRLPLPEASGDVDAQSGEHAARLPADLRVLVVEDNKVNRMVALAMLESLGLTADVAHDGVEALERLAEKRYDVVLMDVMMPRLDGVGATRAIRERFDPGPRIVAMSANASASDGRSWIEAGMDGCVTKPVTRAALAEALAKWGASS